MIDACEVDRLQDPKKFLQQARRVKAVAQSSQNRALAHFLQVQRELHPMQPVIWLGGSSMRRL